MNSCCFPNWILYPRAYTAGTEATCYPRFNPERLTELARKIKERRIDRVLDQALAEHGIDFDRPCHATQYMSRVGVLDLLRGLDESVMSEYVFIDVPPEGVMLPVSELSDNQLRKIAMLIYAHRSGL